MIINRMQNYINVSKNNENFGGIRIILIKFAHKNQIKHPKR